MTLRVGDEVLGEYRIEGHLGVGAYGDVYRVTNLGLAAVRALKVLRREDPGVGSTKMAEAERRFRQEAQLGSHIRHPGLLVVHFLHSRDGVLALDMDYAPGGSLASALKQLRDDGLHLAVDRALALAIDVAEALGALHERDVVHRDLKPSNVLLDRAGRALVADLGLAQTPEWLSISMGRPHPGTPGYMSPEQRGSTEPVTGASDVYGLGVLLFEMLTGRAHFNVSGAGRLEELRPETPPGVVQLVERMLAKAAAERPADGEAAAAALRATALRVMSEADDAVTSEPDLGEAVEALTAGEYRRAIELLERLEAVAGAATVLSVGDLLARARELESVGDDREQMARDYAMIVRLAREPVTRDQARRAWERFLATYADGADYDPENVASILNTQVGQRPAGHVPQVRAGVVLRPIPAGRAPAAESQPGVAPHRQHPVWERVNVRRYVLLWGLLLLSVMFMDAIRFGHILGCFWPAVHLLAMCGLAGGTGGFLAAVAIRGAVVRTAVLQGATGGILVSFLLWSFTGSVACWVVSGFWPGNSAAVLQGVAAEYGLFAVVVLGFAFGSGAAAALLGAKRSRST